MAKGQPKRPNWEEIAGWYSDGNQKTPIQYTWTNSNGTTGLPGSGDMNLNPAMAASRDAFLKHWYGKKQDFGTRRSAVVQGMPFLSTLIHEALHNRKAQGDFDPGNEIQENDLGVRLVPDLLQRFFGVRMDSRLGREVTDIVLRQLRRP